ncbi:MAG: hypothetical protein FJ291_09270 [Planctomycetes bacterium]|nr:hypothetical protein [Planctomycetota bacterium]
MEDGHGENGRGKPSSFGGAGRKIAYAAIVVLLLAILFVLFVPICVKTTSHPPGSRCRSNMRMLHVALRFYLDSFEQFFPPAWHVDGTALAEDLSNLSYHRFLLTESAFAGFHRRITPDDLARAGGSRSAALARKIERLHTLWLDSVGTGWTADRFAPETVFRMPDPLSPVFDRHANYAGLTELVGVGPADRPLLADVNASLPSPEARDPKDPEHEAEMRRGFSVVKAAGIDVFVGVGPSLRRAGDLRTSRFDFRHQGAANVLFLDGHVDRVKAEETGRLEKIHRYWDSLNPQDEASKGPGGQKPP